MIYLILSIVASSLIFLIFKLLEKYKLNTLLAIVINYIVACVTGILSYEESINVSSIANSKWFIGAILLGFLFITIFNVMAMTSQKNGLSVASVASKMSVVIPVTFGIYAYNESIGFQKLFGILLALIAVYLASVKSKTKVNFKKNLMYPLLLFCGSGIIDTSIKYLESTYLSENGIPVFSATIFFFAAIIGTLLLLVNVYKKKFIFDFKSVFFGVILGVVNYCSIYFLLKALHFEGTESSTIFTINNVAIVMLSTLLGLFLFKERITPKNWAGIGLAVVAIILVSFA